jgi:hypothetical protein
MFSFVSNDFQNLPATPHGTVAAWVGIISGINASHYWADVSFHPE